MSSANHTRNARFGHFRISENVNKLSISVTGRCIDLLARGLREHLESLALKHRALRTFQRQAATDLETAPQSVMAKVTHRHEQHEPSDYQSEFCEFSWVRASHRCGPHSRNECCVFSWSPCSPALQCSWCSRRAKTVTCFWLQASGCKNIAAFWASGCFTWLEAEELSKDTHKHACARVRRLSTGPPRLTSKEDPFGKLVARKGLVTRLMFPPGQEGDYELQFLPWPCECCYC